jgi:iron uptake system component EfeO
MTVRHMTTRPMTIRPLIAALGVVAVLALAGCVPNAQPGGMLTVAISDDACDVSAPTAAAGDVTFTLTNSGTDVNEFYVLAEDQQQVVGEKEDLVPGATADFTITLDAGTYYTGCKFQQAGELVGLAEFTVTPA